MDQFYLVFRGDNPPVHSGDYRPGMSEPLRYVRYELITVVSATGPEDACHQVAETIGQLGGYVAVECTPYTFNLTPRRLAVEAGQVVDHEE